MDSIEGMESVVASVSGYHGCPRFQLIKLISHTGASYVGAMSKSTTHLVCWRFKGKKYDFARSIGAQIVSHRWFEECLKAGKRIPEGPYVMESGEEAGPISWEIPASTAHGESKQTLDRESSILSDCSNFTSSSRNVKTNKRNSDIGCSSWTDSLLLDKREFITSESEKIVKKRKKSDHGSRSEDNNLLHNQNNISEVLLSEWDEESGYHSFRHRPRHQTSLHDFIEDNNIGKPSRKKRRLVKMVSEIKGKGHLSINSNSERDKQPECNKLCESREGCSGDGSVDISAENEERDEAALSKQRQLVLSCVICWTEFSSTRGCCFVGIGSVILASKIGLIVCFYTACPKPGKRRRIRDRLGEPVVKKQPLYGNQNPHKLGRSSTRMGDLLGSPCVADFGWVSFLAYPNLFGNKGFEEVSIGKSTTCPLCKALFTKITRVEEADTSDQKIYSQTIPSGSLSTEIFVSAGAGDRNFQTMHEEEVCYACHNREPVDLLLNCHICHSKWVHSYCLDPPQSPWTCVDCQDLRMLYYHSR